MRSSSIDPDGLATIEPSTVCHQVISKVADLTGVEPLELEPLYETVDLELLTRALDPNWVGADDVCDRITFTYTGCEVTLTADGEVSVRPHL